MTDAPPPRDREARVARRVVSPALFAVVAISFFLPFVTIACAEGGRQLTEDVLAQLDEIGGTPIPDEPPNDSEVATLSGWELVRGDEGELGEAFGATAGGEPPLGQVNNVQPFAIAALAIAILGIALSWLALWIGPIAGSAFGIAGVVVLFLLKGRVENILPVGAGFFDIGELVEFRWQIWFWIAMAAFGLAAGWSLFRLLSEARARTAMTSPPTPPPPTE